MAQLLYLSNRACPDTQTSVFFLCTRVRGPATDDCNNLARVINYIQGTIFLLLIFSIEKSGNIKWYADAAFEVNKDMSNHTGGFMNIGTGVAYVQSSKQKLNTKSSTEAKLLGVDDVLTQLIWTR